MCSLMSRATVSVPPPAAYGTTIVTGLPAGCAAACDVRAASKRQALVSTRRRSITVSSRFFLTARLCCRARWGNGVALLHSTARPLHQHIGLALFVAAALGALDLAEAVRGIEADGRGVSLEHPEAQRR